MKRRIGHISTVRPLREKYVEMLRLRTEHAAGTERDVRRSMVALARRFPGALRELDELPLDEIQRRIDHLDDVEAGAPAEPWVHVSARYHALLRGALAARGAPTEATDEERAAWSETRGPIVGAVLKRLSVDLVKSERELRKLLFPFARRKR